MTTYFTAPDGHGEPALWVAQGDLAPAALIRRCDLGPMAHHWDELVARVIAGNVGERPCAHESWQLDGNQRTCADCGRRLSDDRDRQPRRINPTFIT